MCTHRVCLIRKFSLSVKILQCDLEQEGRVPIFICPKLIKAYSDCLTGSWKKEASKFEQDTLIRSKLGSLFGCQTLAVVSPAISQFSEPQILKAHGGIKAIGGPVAFNLRIRTV